MQRTQSYIQSIHSFNKLIEINTISAKYPNTKDFHVLIKTHCVKAYPIRVQQWFKEKYNFNSLTNTFRLDFCLTVIHSVMKNAQKTGFTQMQAGIRIAHINIDRTNSYAT